MIDPVAGSTNHGPMNSRISARDRDPVFAIPLTLPAAGSGQLTGTLHRQLRAAIIDGRLAAGTAMPSSRKAADALGIARNTAVAIYDLLIAEGYLLPRKGARPVVADIAMRHPRVRAAPKGAATQLRKQIVAPTWQSPSAAPHAPQPLPPRSFRLGVPEHRHFPHEIWRRLNARAWRRWSKHPFDHPPIEGIPPLREAIAHHVAFARAVACTGDDVVVTSGAQQAFDLLARLLVTPAVTRVAVEDPGYEPLRRAFQAAGARLVPVPVDDEGLRVDLLPTDVRVICASPSHQSPTGVALSMSRRAALLAHARMHDAVVIEDDYDGEFRYSSRPLDALQTLDRDARVFYVGTFSKSMFPAMNAGFVVSPSWARDALLAVKRVTETHSAGPLQEALAEFIREGHLARHIRKMTATYAERREALLEGLHVDLHRWLEAIPSIAGIHLAAKIDAGANLRAVVDAMHRHLPGAEVVPGDSTRPGAPSIVAMGFGVIDVEDIRPAIRRVSMMLSRNQPDGR